LAIKCHFNFTICTRSIGVSFEADQSWRAFSQHRRHRAEERQSRAQDAAEWLMSQDMNSEQGDPARLLSWRRVLSVGSVWTAEC